MTTLPDKPLPKIHQNTLSCKAVDLFAIGILLAFFAPWLRQPQWAQAPSEYVSAFALAGNVGGYYKLLWCLPVFSLATIVSNHTGKRTAPLGILLFVSVTLSIAFIVAGHRSVEGLLFPLGWGAWVSMLFALAVLAIIGEPSVASDGDLISKRFNTKKADVSGHWCAHVSGYTFSAKEFYAEIERKLEDQKIPSMSVLRLGLHEGGVVSEKREYLRLIRERLVFDICAAPFGTGYFFSVRDAEIPAVVGAGTIIALGLFTLCLLIYTIQTFGIIWGPLVILMLSAFLIWFLRNALRLGLRDLDAFLIKLPAIGSLYEAWFRRDTYFRQDLRLIYRHVVSELVKEEVEILTAAKGVKLLRSYEYSPILGELYKASITQLGEAEAK